MGASGLLTAPPPYGARGPPLYAHSASGDTKGVQPPETRQCVMSEANCGFPCGPGLSLPSGGRVKREDWGQCPGAGMKAWGLQRQPPPPRPGGGVGQSAHLWDLPSGFPNGHMRPDGTESTLPPHLPHLRPRERRKALKAAGSSGPLLTPAPGLSWRQPRALERGTLDGHGEGY